MNLNAILESDMIPYLILVGVAAFLIGLMIGAALYSKRLFKKQSVGTLIIDDTNQDTTQYRFVLDGIPLEDLPKKSYISLKIKIADIKEEK